MLIFPEDMNASGVKTNVRILRAAEILPLLQFSHVWAF